MKDYISIGHTYCEESGAQVGELDYSRNARAECMRFLRLLRKQFGPEPEGVCYYHTDRPAAADYAFRCESETPAPGEDV